MGVLSRMQELKGVKAAAALGKPAGLLGGFPGLWEFMSAVTWPDGVSRRTGTLLVFVEDGMLKACLSDRDQSKVAFFSGTDLEVILEGLEAGLQMGALDWRASSSPRRR